MMSVADLREADERFMAAALALGRRGLGTSAPNPSVGALVVKDDIIVGRGVTAAGGRPHAETVALAQAGDAARGATLYVTLEPCAHHAKTPPCCEAVVAAGIARLVYAIDDPNPATAGQGAAFCRAQGLSVVGDIGAAVARRDHLGHILRMTAGRPMVSLKLAETADGFVAGGQHDPRLAITGVVANGLVHVMRAMHDAIMVGIGTVLIDDPLMTVRLPGVASEPTRVVLDSTLSLPETSRLTQTTDNAPLLVLTTSAGAARPHRFGPGVAIGVIEATPSGQIDLAAALRDLARRGMTRVFSEGGPTIASALITQGLADDVLMFKARKPLGSEGVATMTQAARDALSDAERYRLAEIRDVGLDQLRRYERII